MKQETIDIQPPFFLREEYTDEILKLLKSVTLGSNGAKYQHQNIEKRIQQLYQPLFLNLERNHKVLGNITFCRRPENWYIRYFAFDLGMQSSINRVESGANKNSRLKREIEAVFQKAFTIQENSPQIFYAYIDPKNERSLWMSQSFEFKTVAKIATQTFSRVKPSQIKTVTASPLTPFIKEKIEEIYSSYPFYFPHHTFNESPFYVLKKEGKIVAFVKTHIGSWKISRLPGKNGKILKHIIPYVPKLRKVIRPNSHIFTVIDSVWSKDNDASLLEELLSGILYEEKTNTILWWVDEKEPIYKEVKNKINWGLLHKVNGVHQVDLVVKSKQNKDIFNYHQPTYVTGIDFV